MALPLLLCGSFITRSLAFPEGRPHRLECRPAPVESLVAGSRNRCRSQWAKIRSILNKQWLLAIPEPVPGQLPSLKLGLSSCSPHPIEAPPPRPASFHGQLWKLHLPLQRLPALVSQHPLSQRQDGAGLSCLSLFSPLLAKISVLDLYFSLQIKNIPHFQPLVSWALLSSGFWLL